MYYKFLLLAVAVQIGNLKVYYAATMQIGYISNT